MKSDANPVFYIDEDLDSDDFVDPLLAAGFTLQRHRDNFAPGTADEEWIPEVARRGWYAFSRETSKSCVRSRSGGESLGMNAVDVFDPGQHVGQVG